MKELITAGIPPDLSKHLEARGIAVRNRQFRDLTPAAASDGAAGGILLGWDGFTGQAAKFLDALGSVKKKPAEGEVPAPLYLIVTQPETNTRVVDLAKKAGVAGIFKYPSEVFKLDMATHDLVPKKAGDKDVDLETFAALATFPHRPQKKRSVNDILSLCARLLAAPEPPAERARRVYFFCDKPELAEQAGSILAKSKSIDATFFTSPVVLVDAVFEEAPGNLLLFTENNPEALIRVLDKIGLSRRLPRFGIQVMVPGEQARSHFLRAASSLLFDQISITSLTAKGLADALKQLNAIGMDEGSPRRKILELRSVALNPQASREELMILLASVQALPGKARLAAREEFFISLARGDLNDALAQMDVYAKQYPDDAEMWLSMRALLRSRQMGAEACLDKCLAIVARNDVLAEVEHRQMLKAMEDDRDLVRLQKYIDLRFVPEKEPDVGLKYAFLILAGLTGDHYTEMQWIMDLLSDSPADPVLLMRLGKALERMRDFASAGRVYMLGAKAAPKIKIQFDLLHLESLAQEGRRMRAEEKLALLEAEFPGDPRIARLAKKLGIAQGDTKISV